MTQEEKSKAYDEAIGKLQGLIDNANKQGHIIVSVEDIENSFPELKESEDERIRKDIIEMLRNWASVHYITKEQFSERMAWLEKQGEKKSADKVEPRFHEGEWVANDYCVGKVIALTDDAYLLDSGPRIPFSYEHKAHLWTIQDAKDGDVLVGKIDGDDYILIFKQIKDGWIETYGHYYGAVDRVCVPSQLFCKDYKGTFYPTTKELCDFLFSKMKEAGYEWDADKKELKKIEQTPVEFNDTNAKRMFIKALERVEEQNNKGYKLTDCDKNSWWEDFKAYTSCVGEQKSTNNPDPEFHEGEWVVYNHDICQIVKREEGCNKLVTVFGIEKELVNERNLSTAHLWTIQDAKDGDVLVASDGSIFLFAGVVDYACKYYAVLTAYNEVKIKKEVYDSGYWETSRAVRPATKEHRDLLFSKMKEAGYEWDADKKELKIVDWSKHIKYNPNATSITEEKPAWTEEDTKKLYDILSILGGGENCFYNSPILIDWLKSLKERIGG